MNLQFEEWYKMHLVLPEKSSLFYRLNGEYINYETQLAYEAWCAATKKADELYFNLYLKNYESEYPQQQFPNMLDEVSIKTLLLNLQKGLDNDCL